MPFREYARVEFVKCPLVEVVCQIKFPAILAIETGEPVMFQEAIREFYPIYEEIIEQQQQLTLEPPSPGLLVQPIVKSSSNKNYKFTSIDGTSWINLTRNFIALTTKKYSRWEVFLEQFMKPFSALIEIYKPSFFERIGLRYIDVFCRSELGLVGTKWSELFKPQVLGMLSCEEELNDSILSHNLINEIRLTDNKSILRLNSSLVVPQDAIYQDKDTEKCVMIDGDFFTLDRFLDPKLVIDKLVFLHERSTRLIRWLITDKLYNAMEPKDI